jgi:hypothetical protein
VMADSTGVRLLCCSPLQRRRLGIQLGRVRSQPLHRCLAASEHMSLEQVGIEAGAVRLLTQCRRGNG